MNKTIECWHGVNPSPSYYPFEICSRILVPFNLVYEGKIKIEWVKETFYPKGSRGKKTEFILTARIKKINNGEMNE